MPYANKTEVSYMEIVHYMDGHIELPVRFDSEDVEMAKLLHQYQSWIKVIKAFIHSGYRRDQAVCIVAQASGGVL